MEATNSVLRERPRLHVSKRTVRYYISQGVVPAPEGPPKYARYGIAHLARIVGARILLDSGMNLETANRRLDSLAAQQALVQGVERLIGGASAPAELAVRETRPVYKSRLRQGSPIRPRYLRISLTPDATLELKDTDDLENTLQLALQALQQEIEDSFGST